MPHGLHALMRRVRLMRKRWPESKSSRLRQLERAHRRRRAKNKVARASRKRNR